MNGKQIDKMSNERKYLVYFRTKDALSVDSGPLVRNVFAVNDPHFPKVGKIVKIRPYGHSESHIPVFISQRWPNEKDPRTYVYRVHWNNGCITWEPMKNLGIYDYLGYQFNRRERQKRKK